MFCLLLQGPLGWQSLESFLPRDMDLFVNANDHADISAISWEAAIQKHVEEELYSSSLRVVATFLSILTSCFVYVACSLFLGG